MTDLNIVHCTHERHAAAILEIFNDAIVNSTALYDYQPRTVQNMVSWFENKRTGNWPVIGIEDAQGQLLGFCSYGSFRAYPAYKYTVEHSVYVHPQHRGHGLGRKLMDLLIDEAKRRGDVHAIVGAIDAANEGSIALHKRLGFEHVGQMPQVGFKFGRWLDLAFYQLTLQTPLNPVDG
ncbi:N-acetyltransferase [Comamonas testosteroni]|uniref:N-acetyltransferase n=1 Tax=Comamonas testosteroni TaxID=285 RepID=A0A373FSG1_COMTE|nr:GNAT family N-acetyltransferase [Comamonas testosteroni]RGE47113.1 N-acetyltransferase [Comamonas testosteroni]